MSVTKDKVDSAVDAVIFDITIFVVSFNPRVETNFLR